MTQEYRSRLHPEGIGGKEVKNFTPTRAQYNEKLRELSDNLRGTVMLRLASETGIVREELATIERGNLDRMHKQGLWVEKAKMVKRGGRNEYAMRSREVPINSGLYTLLQAYLATHTSPYIVDRLRHTKEPTRLTNSAINFIFDQQLHIEWSPHRCRHFFKNQVYSWLRKNRMMDGEAVRSIMGHQNRDAHEGYGSADFEWGLEIVEGTFGSVV